jgi:hypothetical protein
MRASPRSVTRARHEAGNENLGIFHYRTGFNGCLYLYQGVSIGSRFVPEALAGMRFNQ